MLLRRIHFLPPHTILQRVFFQWNIAWSTSTRSANNFFFWLSSFLLIFIRAAHLTAWFCIYGVCSRREVSLKVSAENIPQRCIVVFIVSTCSSEPYTSHYHTNIQNIHRSTAYQQSKKKKIKIEYFNKFLSLNRILTPIHFVCISLRLFNISYLGADVTGVFFDSFFLCWVTTTKTAACL